MSMISMESDSADNIIATLEAEIECLRSDAECVTGEEADAWNQLLVAVAEIATSIAVARARAGDGMFITVELSRRQISLFEQALDAQAR